RLASFLFGLILRLLRLILRLLCLILRLLCLILRLLRGFASALFFEEQRFVIRRLVSHGDN
ncbi:hypothetical protein PtrCC142_012345, partial [Pyrenophora tritici-repentis]